MPININHLFESNVPDGEDNNLVQPSDWNALHVLSGGGIFKLPQLVEEKDVSLTQNTSVTFSNLDGNTDEEYFLEFYLDSTNGAVVLISFNGDTNTNYYTTYLQLQETDGNNHHLTNWNNSRSISRIYATSPYIGRGRFNIFNMPSYGVHLIGHFAMFPAGWGEVSTHYIPASFSNLTSISLGTSDNVTIVGKAKLYKMVDFDLGGE